MQLYIISNDGDLESLSNLDFEEDSVYIVDDNTVIYIWVGLQSSQKKKSITADFARKLDKERGNRSKILIMKQGREYGSFLAMMDHLKNLKKGISIERRPELKLDEPQKLIEPEVSKIPKMESSLAEPENFGLEIQIREAAYFLSLDNYSYDDLCWMLAEKILKHSFRILSVEDIKKKAEQVFKSSCTYDELCWLNAEMDYLYEKEFLVKKTHF